MSCLQHCYGSLLGRHRQHASGGRSPLPSVLSGTWDFKWRVGKEIRVAFQALPSDVRGIDYARGKALVVEKLDDWLGGRAEKNIPKPNLSYSITADLPAPPEAASAPRPPAGNGPAPRFAKSADGGPVIDYDVLVSFLPLPVFLPSNEHHREETVVGTSASELGRYALRSEYGIPTIYLGPQFGFSPEEWFDTPEGIFSIVHELGHVLGMPHEQQNPTAGKLPWKSRNEVRDIVKSRKGLSPSMDVEEFIEFEILDEWPGEQRFSDWRQSAAVAPDYDFDSVMAKPSYRCLLRGVHDERCTPQACPTYENDLAKLSAPTDSDLKHLITMYGTRP